MTTLALYRRSQTEVEPVYSVYSTLNEDLVRASLLKAIAALKEASKDWFSLPLCAKNMHISMERYLNDELDALFHGTFAQLELKRQREARRREVSA